MLALFPVPVILQPYKSIGQHILYEENGNKHVQAVPKLCGLDHRLSDVTCDSHQHQVLV